MRSYQGRAAVKTTYDSDPCIQVKLIFYQEFGEVQQEFEFFDPQTPHDFEGFKRLLRQLFDVDATSFHLGAIADLILAQPLLGSTIKTEGNESDPHAFMTILNLEEHKVL